MWTRDIDRHPPGELLTLLEAHTHQPVNDLMSMTLGRYEGVLYADLPLHGDVIWLLPLGVFHRDRKRPGMQFCPQCLSSDLEPYYRLPWRLALQVICPYHHCVMMDSCPRCKSPVMFHRHGVGRAKIPYVEHLRHCHSCQLDFGTVIGSAPNWPDQESLDAAVSLLDQRESLSLGRPGLAIKFPCELPFYSGLRTIIALLNGRHGERLQATFSDALGIEPFVQPQMDFEYVDVQRRLRIVLCACWLLGNWPYRFVDCCLKARLTRSRFTEEPDSLPFWLASVARDHLDCRLYLPSDAEVDAAISVIQKKGGDANGIRLAQLFDVDLGCARRLLRRWRERQG